MKRMLTRIASLPDWCYNKFVLRYRRVEYGPALTIHGRLRVFGHGTIRIGRNVTINSGLSANPIGGDIQAVFSLKNTARLTIGDGVGISNTAIVCHDQVTIGDRTIIGGGTKIYDTNFHSLDYRERGDYQNETVATRPVTIGEDVFIGGHCIILKGVAIGARSVIGAGSVVTRDVPADEVWGGNPARRIRKNAELRLAGRKEK